jgi:hypothetical protein
MQRYYYCNNPGWAEDRRPTQLTCRGVVLPAMSEAELCPPQSMLITNILLLVQDLSMPLSSIAPKTGRIASYLILIPQSLIIQFRFSNHRQPFTPPHHIMDTPKPDRHKRRKRQQP